MTEACAVITPRAQRFANRLRGEPEQTFAAQMRAMNAARHAAALGDPLKMTLALLAARPALDRELNGARLQALAAVVGDDLLDAVREAELDAISPKVFETVLPPAATLVRRAERLLARAGTSPEIAALADLAAALVRRTGVTA
jgi:hypothetical protein